MSAADSGLPGPGTAGELARRIDLPEAPGRAHLLGAGGAGMRGLAVLLAAEGWSITGCDLSEDAEAPEIERTGGRLLAGHDPVHVEGVDLVVRSSAVPEAHPELGAARDHGVPVWRRARALAALVNDRELAAVAGTHGKTTVTAMASLAAQAAGLEPTGVVGGVVPAWGGHAVAGAGPAVVEADEYDGSFLELDPRLALVTAVEPEHLESYGGMETLERAYRVFAARAVDRIGVLFCADDPGAREIGSALKGARGYGLAPTAAYHIRRIGDRRVRLEAPEGAVETGLAAPGDHNLQNAAGALAVALRLGASPAELTEALEGFGGVERRMQELVDVDGTAVVDDYAHHPTEVRAALAAARRAYPGRRLVAVFQPHLYSRTRRFAVEFAEALATADDAVVLPVYPAREEPIPGVDADLVAEAGAGIDRVDEEEALDRVLVAGREEAVAALFLGAGDVTRLAHRVAGKVSGHAVGA